jgi:pimeloyl-ACP methyl ester carboxylesterase
MNVTEERVDVVSADSTRLAVWIEGDGPPLVMVHGSMHDHTANRTFVDAFEDRVTTWSMDRRGFGPSGDQPPWALDREFEDVAAVVEAAAAQCGSDVALWGHSFGASCAMGAATLTDRVSHVVLYEPSLGLRYPPGSIDAVDRALATGDHERVLTEVLENVLELSTEDIGEMRATPTWPMRLATAPIPGWWPLSCSSSSCETPTASVTPGPDRLSRWQKGMGSVR